MKQRIRLTESNLYIMIKESVKQVLKENIDQFGTIMQTACSYMEEFRMGDLSKIVFHYEYNKPTQVINALLTARDKARKYMEMGADDADDFYNAVNNAYMEFSKKVLTTNNASQNESRLKQTIRESVRQVLKESIDYKSIVEAFLEENGMYNAPIEWITNNKFVDAHGCDGYIFNSEDDAINSLMNGDNYQNAIDYVNTSQSEEEWVKYLINGGVKPQIANSIIQNQDWDKVIEIIIDTVGPEWFLSQYSGEAYELPNGKLLYY